MRLLVLIISIGIAVLPKLAQAQTDCGMPSIGEDHWQVAAPESVGLTSATLCEMVKWIDDWKQSNVHAVLVVRHGTLVFEHYFSGADEHWGRPMGEVAFGPEIKHDERSATKSIGLSSVQAPEGCSEASRAPRGGMFTERCHRRRPR